MEASITVHTRKGKMERWRLRQSPALGVLYCFLILPGHSNEAESTLRLVNVLFRHGDRSPMRPLPNSDQYTADDWPQGYAQLTSKGIQQEYQLGHLLRERYDGFLNKKYVKDEIHVESTDTERTLMSAQSVIAALYRPVGLQQWHPHIAWQPVPVHPSTWTLQIRKCNDPKVKRGTVNVYRLQNKDLFETVEAGLGTAHIEVGTLWGIYDTLYCQEQHNKTWPGWVSQEIMKMMSEDILPKYLKNTYSRQQNRADVLHYMTTKMKHHISNSPVIKGKLFLLSGHDTNVLCLLNSLQVYNDRLVPYSTAVILELHYGAPNDSSEKVDDTEDLYAYRRTHGLHMGETERRSGRTGVQMEEVEGNSGESIEDAPRWFVRVWLRNDTTRGPYQLTLPGCSPDCPWDDFQSVISSSIDDLLRSQDSCKVKKISKKIPSHLWQIVFGMMGVGGLLTIAAVLVSLFFIYKHRKRRQRLQAILYRQLNTEEIPMSDADG